MTATSPSEDRGGPAFSDAEIAGLPAVVARYFRASIAPGTPLASAAWISMRGRIRIGRWLPFTARELLAPHAGYDWRARVAGALFVGSDRSGAAGASMRWKLFGLVPVVRSSGHDLEVSAAGRAGGEAIWLPTSLLPRFGVTWEAEGDAGAVARFAVDATPVELHLRFDEDGRLTSLRYDRWGDPERTGTWCWHPFGGTVREQGTFAGMRVPSAGTVGWHFGTDRWPHGQFCRYELTGVEPCPESAAVDPEVV